MPYKYNRICPICNRPDVKHLACHLRNKHGLPASERRDLLRMAMISSGQQQPIVTWKTPVISTKVPARRKCTRPEARSFKRDTKTTQSYTDFRFKHKFSLLTIGPTQSGKTHLVKEILERDHIEYPEPHKERKILWFYGQHQPEYTAMKKTLGKQIRFQEGLPDFQEDLSDIDPRFNNIIVLDDLMDLALDSHVISKLFTQGRHRNASVILLSERLSKRETIPTSVEMHRIWPCFDVRSTEGRPVWWPIIFSTGANPRS